MKKLMMMSMLGGIAISMVGCKTTLDDRWTAQMDATLSDAHFRPIYEVQKEKGIVKGEATEKYSWWGFVGTGPETFANEIGGPLTLKPGMKEAAFADACIKNNCQILLAPRYTVTKEVGLFWFSGSTKATVEGIPAVLKTAEEIPMEKWVEWHKTLCPSKSVLSGGGGGLFSFLF